MQYYKAREMMKNGSGTGLWHYTVGNSRGDTVYAVGFCSPWDTCQSCYHEHSWQGGWKRNPDGEFLLDENGQPIKCEVCEGSGLIKKADPCPGHATEEEACEHYREYLISQMKIVGPKTEKWPKHKCEIVDCNEEATYLANIAGGHSWTSYEVCEAHANKEAAAKLVQRVGEIWSS